MGLAVIYPHCYAIHVGSHHAASISTAALARWGVCGQAGQFSSGYCQVWALSPSTPVLHKGVSCARGLGGSGNRRGNPYRKQ
jgi:hypothetical protein